MTEGQRRKRNRAIKALAKKELITGSLAHSGGRCALGELLYEAGVRQHCLYGRSTLNPEETKLLLEKYGLTRQAQDGVMGFNDGSSDRVRTRTVLSYIVHYFRGDYVEKPPEDSCGSETTG